MPATAGLVVSRTRAAWPIDWLLHAPKLGSSDWWKMRIKPKTPTTRAEGAISVGRGNARVIGQNKTGIDKTSCSILQL